MREYILIVYLLSFPLYNKMTKQKKLSSQNSRVKQKKTISCKLGRRQR